MEIKMNLVAMIISDKIDSKTEMTERHRWTPSNN